VHLPTRHDHRAVSARKRWLSTHPDETGARNRIESRFSEALREIIGAVRNGPASPLLDLKDALHGCHTPSVHRIARRENECNVFNLLTARQTLSHPAWVLRCKVRSPPNPFGSLTASSNPCPASVAALS